jgi:acetyl esterase/lipase
MKIRGLAGTAIGRLTLLTVMAGSALVGCSPTVLLDAVTPRGDYQQMPDIPYGPEARQTLDVYRPKMRDPRHTAIVFFYGGYWQTGDKGDYRFVAEALTRHGITVVIPDYRLYPAVRFPTFVEDGAQAVGWVYEHAPEIGVDRERIFIMGHSAGAYIAAMLALDDHYLQKVNVPPGDIAGTIGIAGPYNFTPLSGTLFEVFGGRDRPETQPITFAHAGARPMLLVHGEKDGMVYSRNSQQLAAKLQAAGSPVKLVLYPELGHLDIMLGLSSVFSGDEKLLGELDRFLDGKS